MTLLSVNTPLWSEKSVLIFPTSKKQVKKCRKDMGRGNSSLFMKLAKNNIFRISVNATVKLALAITNFFF